MPIIDTILSTPIDIATLDATATLESKLDSAFSNLLSYAKRNWSYTASGSTGGDMLLAGTANSAPCGGIATALKKVFIDGLHVPEGDIEYIRITGYVWTSRAYSCFDPKVQGNVRNLDARGDYSNGCVFNEHYYLKCNNKFYDPCLSAVYAVKNQSVKDTFTGFKNLNVGPGMGRRFLITSDNRSCLLYMPAEPVPGFQGSYALFDATRKNIEKALGAEMFNAEMKVQQGTTGFAKFVNTLH
jgi:hypothetical protein